MIRKASAIWEGDLKSGKGSVSTDSGALSKTQYSFSTRFENGVGTNPEELIAAAHAGCFSMALSAELGKAGLAPNKIETSAALTMDTAEWQAGERSRGDGDRLKEASAVHGAMIFLCGTTGKLLPCHCTVHDLCSAGGLNGN